MANFVPKKSTTEYLKLIIPALALMALFFFLLSFVESKIEGGWGVFLGVVAAVCVVLSVILFYRNSIDWQNVKSIKNLLIDSTLGVEDGQEICFSGVTISNQDPLTAPFTKTPSVAYTYTVGASRRRRTDSNSTRVNLAQGFHMLPTEIQGEHQALPLLAFPVVEDDLRQSESNKWKKEVKELFKQLLDAESPSAGEPEREGQLRLVRKSCLNGVQQDYCQVSDPPNDGTFFIEEESLPANKTVTVIGRFSKEPHGIAPSATGLNRNIMTYLGAADEVVERMSKDVKMFYKIGAGMVALAGLILGYAVVAGN